MSSAFQALTCKIANRHFRVTPTTPNCYLAIRPLFAAVVGRLCQMPQLSNGVSQKRPTIKRPEALVLPRDDA
jgi:hypothetical protein